MSDQNAFSSGAAKTGSNRPEDQWHDLVAAVVALKGSPPVRPPASMLADIERRLGFVPARSSWLCVPAMLGGVAAALVFSLGWLAWKANFPRERDQAVASLAHGAVDGGHASTSSLDGGIAMSPGSAMPRSGVASRAMPPAAMVAKANGSGATAAGYASSQQPRLAASETAFGAPPARGPFGGGEARASLTDTKMPGGATTPLALKKETIDLKSDYYVAGMIAAAMQNPSSANPYEAILQPEEWSDWVAGYELGSEIPPAEALALGASWKWSDPVTVSLVAGMPVDEVGVSDPKAAAIAIEEPKQAAASRLPEGDTTVQRVSE